MEHTALQCLQVGQTKIRTTNETLNRHCKTDTGPDRRIMTVRAAVRHRTTHRTETYGGSYGIIRCLVRCHTVARTSSYGDSYGAVRRLVGSGAATRTVPYDDVPYGGS